MTEMRLIVGLGNPGREYANTRHNLGFMVTRRLAERQRVIFKSCSFAKGLIAEYDAGLNNVALFMPTTYMNNCGTAIFRIIEKFKIEPTQLLLVCDDLNLNFGQIRLRRQGTDGGHNGLKSVIDHIGTKEFARLRIGIDHPGGKDLVTDYVLEPFKSSERKVLGNVIDKAADCCCLWVEEGIESAMGKFNSDT